MVTLGKTVVENSSTSRTIAIVFNVAVEMNAGKGTLH